MMEKAVPSLSLSDAAVNAFIQYPEDPNIGFPSSDNL
jgi:hypothetical protein